MSTLFILNKTFANDSKVSQKFRPGDNKKFDFLEIKGSYYQIGYQIGGTFADNIKTVIKKRHAWHKNLLDVLDSAEGRKRSQKYLQLTEKYFPSVLKEIKGLADGAGVHFDAIWALCIKSELMAFNPEPTGCSTIYYRDQKHQWLFHNEDGHQAYDGQMFVVKVQPPSGITYLYFVYPGTITGNGPGVNKEGIFQTTNYISSTKSKIGIPRYVLGRAVLESKNIQEAMEILTMEPRAYPYHHNVGSMSDGRYLSLETIPQKWQVEEPSGLYYHTNHLLFDKTKNYQFEDTEYKTDSSLSRYRVIENEVENLDSDTITQDSLQNILASHRQAPYSPCRHPQGDVKGITLGTAFFDIKKRLFRLYRGNPCQAFSTSQYSDFPLDYIQT
jgi:predicted choloylglycine hydrolase